ncbi:hypothetical protein ES703_23383 [subsurface metagenome]
MNWIQRFLAAITTHKDDASAHHLLGNLGATCYVVANDAKAEVKAYAEVLQAAGYPVWVCDGTADDVEINAALVAGAGGKVVLLEGNYQITANIVVPASTHLSGMGKGVILTTTDAVGITNMVVINGDNVTISDMKLVLGAGAGDAGSRPNVIYASSKTLIWLENLWIVGDDSVVYDGSLDRQNGILLATVTDSKLTNNKIEDNKSSGIRLVDSSYNTITGNTSESNGHEGIEVNSSATLSEYNVVSNNVCNGNSWNGIANLQTSDHNTYDGNVCTANVECGIFVGGGTGNAVTGNICSENVTGISIGGSYTDVTGNTLYGNTTAEIVVTGDYNNITGNMIWSEAGDESIYLNSCNYCTVSGNSCLGAGASIYAMGITNTTITGNLVQGGSGIILISTSNHNTVTGNTCSDSPSGDGIKVQESHYNTITGNTCRDNAAKGIYIYRSGYNTIVGNTLYSNAEYGIYIQGTSGKQADYNFVTSNNCRDNTYNIEISGGAYANHNRIIDNEVSGGTALVVDAGTDTEFNSIAVPFSDGSEPQDSGYLVDGDGDIARAYLSLPQEVQVVMKLKIYARAVDESGTTMALEINVNGGASNEAYNTHATAAPNTPTTTSNFAANDVIFWELSSAQIVALLGGDSIEVKVLHEAANGGGIATNAYLRAVEIEYQ